MPLPLQQLFRQAEIGQSRSSVLNPLQWMVVILLGGSTSLLAYHAPIWLIILCACLLVATFGLFCGAYVYFMIKDPAALRSEGYALSRYAMENKLLTRDRKMDAGAGLKMDASELLAEAKERRRTKSSPTSRQ